MFEKINTFIRFNSGSGKYTVFNNYVIDLWKLLIVKMCNVRI